MKRTIKLLLLTVLGTWMAGSAWADDYFVNGDGTIGWKSGNEYNLSPAALVNVSDNVWVWAGKMNANKNFRITGINWGGFWATSNGDLLGTEEKSLKNTQDGGDFSFVVAEEGIYKVTVNTSALTIKAEKMAEPTKIGDYYQIATVNDYYWFAGTVTSAESSTAKAQLTADLDFAETGFFPLACDMFKFKGEFDGAGHTISNAKIIGTNNNVAFVRYATGGTNIHDLIIEGSFEGNAKIGGIIGFARDNGGEVKLTNVINKATVHSSGSSDANAGGLVGCATDGVKITALNCANMGAVSGQNGQCAAFAGWTQNGTTFTNCWNSGAISNIENSAQLYRNSGSVTAVNTYDLTNVGDQGIKLNATTLGSGELAYRLNGDQSVINWYQNLGTDADAYPVPFSTHGQVFANGELKCDGTSTGGELTYSNSSSSVVPPHTFEGGNGWCSVCGTLDHNYLTADADGFYSIGTANDLKWFAAIVAEVDQSAKAKLTDNIDYTTNKQGFIGISQSVPFKGVFDGQGKTITIDIVNAGSSRTGLFAYINAATIKNLVVEGSATSSGNNCVGGLGGRSDGDGTLIENVVVKTAVSYTGTNGDATCGGFFANMEGQVTLKNCAFYGSINTGTAEGNGGLVGWAGSGANNKYINCIVAPTAYTQNGNSGDFARNNPTTTNCFKVASDDARLASGEMTWKLNGEVSGGENWYQTIGTDALPMPFGTAKVYANGYLYCDGLPKPGSSFENEEKTSTPDAHNYGEWGFCINEHDGITCDEIQPDFATLTDGYYQISNAKELNWVAVWTARKDASVNVKLTKDIDMTEVANFPGLGSNEKIFTGEFDGQRHIISNMKMDWDREGVGLINRAADGAKVKNVTIAANCSFKGSKAVAALIGCLYGGGDVYVENCGNEGSVETTSVNAGGICGVCYNGTILHLTNVYNVGEITGATDKESGSLSGWMKNAVAINCYSIAGYPTATATHGFQEGNQFARGDGIALTNCYDFGTGNWGTNNSTWGSAFADGRKIAEVNETEMGRVFAGLFDAEGGNVWRMEYDGWAHPVLYDPAKLVLSENVPNRYVNKTGINFTLKRTLVKDNWNTICLPFDLTTSNQQFLFGLGEYKIAELKGVDDETLQFETVTGTMTAGKPYLVMPIQDVTEKLFNNIDITAETPTAVNAGDFTFTGIFEPTLIAENDLFVATGNKLQPSDGTGKLKGFRAYFKTAAGARATSFVVDGGTTTGIIGIDGTVIENGKIYNLNGQKVQNAQKGLYIVNGKKVVVK
ncbi:MAG: hypothetical protein IJ804_06860 [Prevotella sp.]|nr:hypothetical protein [Prevotella sp.]